MKTTSINLIFVFMKTTSRKNDIFLRKDRNSSKLKFDEKKLLSD